MKVLTWTATSFETGPHRESPVKGGCPASTDALTDLTHMDARWYSAKHARFLQPDYYNYGQLSLPTAAQYKLLPYLGKNPMSYLRDPSQHMRYGYVAGNPLSALDWLGLRMIETAGYIVPMSIADEDQFIARVQSRANAGEVLAKPYVQQSQEILMDRGFNLGKSGADGVWGGRSNSAATVNLFRDTIRGAADEFDVPALLIAAQLTQESLGNL